MSEHTPGPWRVGFEKHAAVVAEVGSLAIVADAEPALEEADARLIAAAPDLLEAARIAADTLADCPAGSEDAEHFLRAAIAKATKDAGRRVET